MAHLLVFLFSCHANAASNAFSFKMGNFWPGLNLQSVSAHDETLFRHLVKILTEPLLFAFNLYLPPFSTCIPN